jgi:prevent-host-death family protein
MKTVSVEEFRAHIDEYLSDAANGEVIVTNGGKPWLVLRSITAEEASPEFWQLIRQRRQESGIPWDEAKKDLGIKN